MLKQTLAVFGLIAATQFSLVSLSNAGPSTHYDSPTVNFIDDNLERVSNKTVNCDELMRLARAKTFIFTAGHVVTGDSNNCITLNSTDYDFFQASGAYLSSKSGLCVVWACVGVRSSDGDNS